MDKKQLSERDVCTKFIASAVEAAGWDKMDQIREEVSFIRSKNIPDIGSRFSVDSQDGCPSSQTFKNSKLSHLRKCGNFLTSEKRDEGFAWRRLFVFYAILCG